MYPGWRSFPYAYELCCLCSIRREGKGVNRGGKLGDFVVYPIDPFEVDIEELSQVPVAYTIVGGDVVYSGKD